MIRKLTVSVTNLTEPKNTERLWAGMQYEDNATRISFDLSAVNIPKALYRIDFNSNGAGYHPSKNLTVSSGCIERDIPKLITQYGGEVQATAVITELNSTGKETGVVYSYPVILYFTEVEKSQFGNETVEGNISMMEASVKSMTRRCEDASSDAARFAESAENDRTLTEEARFALEHDSEFVFLGGDAGGSVSAELVVDGVMSDASENPVMNKTVKAYVDRAKDFIVEQGTAEVMVNEGADDEFVATWTYRKWNSGIAECWTSSSHIRSTFTTTWGTIYRSDNAFPQIAYPFSFTGAPICNFDLAYLDSAAGYFFASSSGTLDIYKHTPKIYAWSPQQYVNTREITARISVIGRWK